MSLRQRLPKGKPRKRNEFLPSLGDMLNIPLMFGLTTGQLGQEISTAMCDILQCYCANTEAGDLSDTADII